MPFRIGALTPHTRDGAIIGILAGILVTFGVSSDANNHHPCSWLMHVIEFSMCRKQLVGGSNGIGCSVKRRPIVIINGAGRGFRGIGLTSFMDLHLFS
jgi:hypothetical protein